MRAMRASETSDGGVSHMADWSPADIDLNNKAFLERFPTGERSTVANRFLDVIREGVARRSVPTAAEVVSGAHAATVKARADAFRWNQAERGEKTDRLLLALTRYQDEALAYARWCLAYEHLSPGDKASIKAGRAEVAIAARQHFTPPSPAQLAFIEKLGGDPSGVPSKAEASRYIDQLKAERGYL